MTLLKARQKDERSNKCPKEAIMKACMFDL